MPNQQICQINTKTYLDQSLNLSRHCPRGSCCADENVIHLFSECEFAMIVFTVVFVNVHSEQPENTMWSHNTTFCAFRAVSKDTLRQTLTVPQDYNPLKDSSDAFKVRISLKTALGDEAYDWDESEQFYFQATVAYGMRKSMNKPFNVSDVHICEETKRISFYFVVTDPHTALKPLPKTHVEKAIRMVRARFNNAFSLDDNTLEFIGIEPTLAPAWEQPVTVWLIIFGIIMGLIVFGLIMIIVTGHREKMRKAKAAEKEEENEEENFKGAENGIHCRTLGGSEGCQNEAFRPDDDSLTTL
ncbi:collectrin [Leucoraja erinacea]|uniref:collectrin n=1 Tax=Leucoraja erinaceus TaxID=7782 RepID=UPI002453F6AB|nr:collectrin [Leucoraja erinacea]